MDTEQEILEIKERNKRVELDKRWETSIERKILVAFLTYFVMTAFFFAAELPKPFVNALVPSIAFVISTMTLPVAKKIWLNGK